MTRQMLWVMLTAAAVFIAAGLLLNRRLRREAALALRVQNVQRSVGIDSVTAPAGTPQLRVLRLLAGLGERIARGGLLSANALEDLNLRLNSAGFRGHNMLPVFVGAKLLALIALPLLAWLIFGRMSWPPSVRLAAIAGAGLAGLLLPDTIIRMLHRRHLRAVERGLPDALDMLVICSEAGLGLEPAIDRVGREIVHAHSDVAEELVSVAREMRVNADRRAVLMNLGARTGLASLRRLGVTLVQTLQYGTPLSQALRTLSAEMRQEALTRFESRASRLPTLLTVPMILFILPCVFLIVAGPAMIHVMQALLQ
jgi:tight adherence protein C